VARGLDWDADAYEQASTAQRRWGQALLDSHPWRGDEVVLDAGCGPGGLAESLLGRLPRGRIIAVDVDPAMVRLARGRLARYGGRAVVKEEDLRDLSETGPVDVVFSNAVLHWVPEHERVFRRFRELLRPGGQVLAQFGGRGNIARVVRVADAVARSPEFAPRFRSWTPPWHFEDAEATRRRLVDAGFIHVDARLHEAPVRFEDRAAFAAFVRTAPILPYLTQLGDAALREAFVDRFATAYEAEGVGWELDYVRLTIRATRPTP